MKFAVLILCLTCFKSLAQSSSWPTILNGKNSAKVTLVESAEGLETYQGTFFRFISDSKLNINDVRRFSSTAESVYYALKRIPLDLIHLPKYDTERQTHDIFIYEDINAYDEAVGVKFSAGYYSLSRRAVFLRKDAFINAKKPNNKLLIHELTHLNMHGIIRYSNAWFSEGNAEYLASAFFSNNSYNFKVITSNIRKRTNEFISSNSQVITLPHLEDILFYNSEEWIKYNNSLAPENRYHPYLAALLTVHYYYHLAPQGRAKIAQYISNITSKDHNTRKSAQQQLFQDVDYKKIEANISTFWKKKGLAISFQK